MEPLHRAASTTAWFDKRPVGLVESCLIQVRLPIAEVVQLASFGTEYKVFRHRKSNGVSCQPSTPRPTNGEGDALSEEPSVALLTCSD
jgi:hypothetical protein